MKRINNKRALVLVACLILVLTASVGTTLGYLLSVTEPMTNAFEAASVECEVQSDENGFYFIKNTGNVDAYIRVAIIATWTKSDGTVSAQVPEISFNLKDNWIQAEDGYYYYKFPVQKETDILILENLGAGTVTMDGYSLDIKIVTSAVQADPITVVADAWQSGVEAVSESGELTIKMASKD